MNYDYSTLPNELKAKPQFVLFKIEEVHGRKTKVPYQYDEKKARVSDRSSFCTYHTALKGYMEGRFDGIGFVFTEQDDFIGIDLDKCVSYADDDVNKNYPIYNDLAQSFIDIFDSYTELSQSLTGIHIIIKASNLPSEITASGRKNVKLGAELYFKNRFFAITNIVENGDKIHDRTDELIEVFEKFFKDEKQIETVEVDLSKHQSDEIHLSNAELWSKMFSSMAGKEIEALYKGELINGDHSTSDLSLCNHLAFWTGKSASRMDSMFRESGLMRDKWDEKRGAYLYGEMTIAKAIASTSTTLLDYKSVESDKYTFNFDKPVPEKDLQIILQHRHWEEIERLQADWVERGEKGKMPTAMSPKACANILQEYVKFIIFDLQENTRLAMYVAAEGIYTTMVDHIKRVISWLEPSLNESKANDVIYHIKNDAEIKPRTENRFLIPVQNGVFNLKTKELESFTSDYVFTSKIATPYSTQCENKVIDGWDIETWIESIACHDKQIVKLLWQVINEALNGNYTRKKSIFLLGEGNNGKGTFQDLLINLIGPNNIANLRVNEFDERFKLGMLEGKTLVIGDDVQAGINIDDSANFNSVITGDRVSVELKGKHPYSTVFRCAVIQSTNGMPTFKNKTSGTTRRLLIVPFNADFNNEKENFNIKDVYIRDKDILQYVLWKAINMDFERFDIPDASIEQLETFKVDNDPVLDFKVNVFDELPFHEVPAKFLFVLYQDFCKANYHMQLTNRKFFKEFRKILGVENVKNQKRFTKSELQKMCDFKYYPEVFNWENKPEQFFKNAVFKILPANCIQNGHFCISDTNA